MRRLFFAGVAGSALLLIGAEARAESAPPASQPTTVQEVTVTVRKRAEKLFDVPNAVTAVTGSQVDALRLQDARDLITVVPTAFMQEINAGTARDINIRGIGTPTLFAEPGVAMYIDDVYSSGFISYPTQFYDIERMEVLRGPQGALYGRDAVGGAVNFISHQPTNEFEGYLRGSFASYSRYELEGMANFPLSDTAAIRAVAWRTSQRKGEYYNEFTHQYIDANDSSGGRVVLRMSPFENFTLKVTGEVTVANSPGTNLYFPPFETKTTIFRDTQPRNHFTTSRIVADGTWNTSMGDFTLIAGHRTYDLTGLEDTDLSADPTPTSNNGFLGQRVLTRENTVDSSYGELRWASPTYGPLSLLAGLTYLDESATGGIVSNSVYFSGVLGGPVVLVIDNNQSVRSWAGFVEATWKITDTLSLIGDLRYTNDRKSEDFHFSPSPLLQVLRPSYHPGVLVTTKTFANTSPGLTLAWQPSSTWRAYAKVQSGFRAGGFNFNVGNIANLPYDAETSVNYEAGVKNKFDGGRGYWGLTAYMLRQNNVLVPQFDFSVPGPVASYLANVGKARTYGVELEGGYSPISGLDINASVGWLDAKFTEGTTAFFGSVVGKQLPASRPLTASVLINYRRPVSDSTDLLLNGVYTHRAAGWFDTANVTRADGANLLNLSAGLALQHKYEISGFVQNALDDDYVIAFGGFRPPSSSGVVRAPGRTYGIQVKANF